MNEDEKIISLHEHRQKIAYVELGRIDQGLTLFPDDSRQPIFRGSYYTLGNRHIKDGDQVLMVRVGSESLVIGIITIT